MLGAHRETVPPNQFSPALPLLEKQARFRVPSDAASRPTAGVPLQTPQALMRARASTARHCARFAHAVKKNSSSPYFVVMQLAKVYQWFASRDFFRRSLHVEKLRIARRKPLSRNKNST
jgi:ribosomal protein L39E